MARRRRTVPDMPTHVRCPLCKRQQIYYRRRTDDWVCRQCAKVFSSREMVKALKQAL